MNKFVRGFTLIELMIVVAIIAIIVALGYPSYREHVKKTRRAEGMGQLLELADIMERYYSDQGTYAGATAAGVYTATTDRGYYTLSVDGGADNVQYTIRAAPTSKGDQDTDKCGTFVLNSLGEKSLAGSSLSLDKCWK